MQRFISLPSFAGLPSGSVVLAQIQQLKDGFGLALAVLFMFGFKDKAFVGEVLREMNPKNRQILTSPKTGVSMAAG